MMQQKTKTRGSQFKRGDLGYEQAQREATWNAKMVDRYPDLIIQANNQQEVIEAIKLAKAQNLKVGVRSGGHSWSANHIRQGGLLLDVSRLDAVTIDKTTMTATVEVGRSGHQLANMLLKQGLFFPAGHCKGVCVGGYLLQGGFGWNSRVLGPACMSVMAIDYVNADGELVHASPEQNADMYWAARGAGAGFFGVVVKFYLRLYAKPKIIGAALISFPIERLEEVYRWADAVGKDVANSVELMLIMSGHTPLVKGKGITVFAPIFADSWREAYQALAFMKTMPKGASLKIPFVPLSLEMMYSMVMQHYPENARYAVDNLWTHASIDQLLPHLHKIANSLPSAPSHMLWMNWSPPKQRPDMAFSMEDKTYIALYGVWHKATQDHLFADWAVNHVRDMEHLATGCQLADENLGQRPARFVSDQHLQKLDQIRAKYDPDNRFHPWMGRVTP